MKTKIINELLRFFVTVVICVMSLAFMAFLSHLILDVSRDPVFTAVLAVSVGIYVLLDIYWPTKLAGLIFIVPGVSGLITIILLYIGAL